jgi:thiosulfate/3-mercaptopyruvate sulfurtransferase
MSATGHAFYKTRFNLLLAVLLLVGLSLGVTKNSLLASTDAVVIDSPLIVELEWLKQSLNDPALVVIDARPANAYQSGHVPGAVSLPVQLTFGQDPDDAKVAPINHIQGLISQLGIGSENKAVIYDDGSFIDAARLFWVLETYGHKNVALLRGGYDAWVSKNYPVSWDAVKRNPGKFVPTVIPERLATKLKVRLTIENPEAVIIDARSKDEYSGKSSKTTRYGHIPTAINIPATNNFNLENGAHYLKENSDLAKLYSNVGRDKHVIAYCNRGKESSLTYFIMRSLGYDVSVYDGSWYDWGSDANMPIIAPE